MWNNFFSTIPRFTICFSILLLFLTYFFYFIYLYLSKNFGKFNVLLFYGLEILSSNFRKPWNIFVKKYRHLKSNIRHKFHCLLFFLAFLTSFFPILPVQTCQKILKIFVLCYCADLRFYHKILQDCGFFLDIYLLDICVLDICVLDICLLDIYVLDIYSLDIYVLDIYMLDMYVYRYLCVRYLLIDIYVLDIY